MRRLGTAVTLLLFALVGADASAQQPANAAHLEFFAGVGPSHAFREVDATGVHAGAGVALGRRRGIGLRLEVTGHRYPDQTLYTCIVQDADRCYQTMRRDVSAGIASVTYRLPVVSKDDGGADLYVVAGGGRYRSRRTATAYSDCQPAGTTGCERSAHTLRFRDTQPGFSGGVGGDLRMGRLAAFVEGRVHYVSRTAPRGAPTNDYFLMPFALGVRF